MSRSDPEAVLRGQLERVGFEVGGPGSEVVPQYRFYPDRELRYRHALPPRRVVPYRFDFAIPAHWLAIEVEGGVFVRAGKGAHSSSVRGYLKDVRKYALALLAGWRVLRVTRREIDSGEALDWIEVACGRELAPVSEARQRLGAGGGRVRLIR